VLMSMLNDCIPGDSRKDTAPDLAPASQAVESSAGSGLPLKDSLPRCELCGNEYDKAFIVVQAGRSHVFDSFECAIHAIAPICGHCGCRIVGHGMESAGGYYCCAHCAGESGVEGLRDRVG
jgi:hypothetical protein